jgi:hypothetical protein
MPPPRVSPPRVFPAVTRAGKPPADGAGSPDAYRQTGFVLGADLELTIRGLELEADIASASAAAKYRSQPMVAAMGLWSRSWLARLEAMHAAEWGSYSAAISLVRSAADSMAAEIYLLQTGAVEWQDWLVAGGIALAPDVHATEYRLHAFRAAEVLAAHELLGPIYRVTMDLSMPHFGATLLLAGSDSTPDRVLMTFGDRDFHLGLAELVFGWLELLSVAQLEALEAASGVFAPASGEAQPHFRAEARALAGSGSRCRVESIERDGERRYLVQNWRRTPGGAATRVLL